jgi:hypothetical protein
MQAVLYETTAANKLDKQTIAQTVGHLIAAAAGLEVGYKKITVGGNIQLPVMPKIFLKGKPICNSKPCCISVILFKFIKPAIQYYNTTIYFCTAPLKITHMKKIVSGIVIIAAMGCNARPKKKVNNKDGHHICCKRQYRQ